MPNGERAPYFEDFALSVCAFSCPVSAEDVAALNRDIAKQIASASGEPISQADWQVMNPSP